MGLQIARVLNQMTLKSTISINCIWMYIQSFMGWNISSAIRGMIHWAFSEVRWNPKRLHLTCFAVKSVSQQCWEAGSMEPLRALYTFNRQNLYIYPWKNNNTLFFQGYIILLYLDYNSIIYHPVQWFYTHTSLNHTN